MICESHVTSRLPSALLVGLLVTCAVSISLASDGRAYSRLVDLGQANGEEYVTLRDALLAKADGPWEVAEAANVDWRAGLAALVCNVRLAYPSLFAEADKVEMVQTRSGRWQKYYGEIRGDREAFTVLMIETVWKTSEHPDVRRWALHELRSRGVESPWELWEAVWSSTADEMLRETAIRALAAETDSKTAEGIVTEVLRDSTQTVAIRLGVLGGFARGRPRYALNLVKSELRNLAREEKLASPACSVMLLLGGREERQIVLDIAADRTEPVALRVAAIGVCDNRPQDDDIPVLLAAMRDADHPEVQLAAVQCSIAYSYKALRAGLRSLLATDTNVEVAEAAMRRLVMCRNEGDQEFVRAFRDRQDISDELRRAIDRQFRILASKEVNLEHMRRRARETGVNLELIERIIAGQRSCEPNSKPDDE